jgi:queuosine precursor transporter
VIAAGQLAVPAAAFFDHDAAYAAVFSVSLKTAVAGLVAFFAGDICNSYVLAKMKIWDQGRRLWARFVASTAMGEGVNTIFFYGIALHGVLPQRLLWLSVLVGWSAKVAVEVLLLPLSYAVVLSLKSTEGVDYYDHDTDFNPFRVR